MNFKLTFALVLVLLVITGIFVSLSNRKPTDKNAPKAETTPLFAAPIEIKEISYWRDGKLQMGFAKEGERWQMTHPVKAAADQFAVEGVARTLNSLAYKEKFEPATDGPRSPVETGTLAAKHTVMFTDASGKEHKLGIGKRTVGGVFAVLNGDRTIYVLASNPADELDKEPQAFRDKNIQNVPQDQVTKLVIKRADQVVELTRSSTEPESAWMISSPITARASGTMVADMLRVLGTIRATGFSEMTKDMPAVGLTPPVMAVTAEFGEEKGGGVTLELGYFTDLTSKQSVYASLGGAGGTQIFVLPAGVLKMLNRELKDLRDPAVTPVAISDVTGVKITSVNAANTLELAKKDGHWRIASLATPVKAGELAVGDFLGDLRNLRAINFVDGPGNLKAIGLDPPQTTIALTLQHQSSQEVILIGKPETAERVTPLMRQGEPTVYMAQTGDVEKLFPTVLTLRDKAVERLASERVRTVAISGAGVTLQHEGAVWKAVSDGKSLTADDELITSLLVEFTPLTAVKYLSQDAAVSGTPEVTVAVTFTEVAPPEVGPAVEPTPAKETAVTRTLKMFKAADGKWKAVWDGPGIQWTFEPTPELVQLVTKTVYGVETVE